MKKYNIEQLNKLQNRLKKQFEYTFNLNDNKSFFLGIADYVKIVEDSDYLSDIVITHILNERTELIKDVAKISDKSVRETKKTFHKINAIIQKRKIKNDCIYAVLKDYDDFITGKIHISGGGNFANHLVGKVRNILIALLENGYKDIADNYAEFDNNSIIIGWKISKSESDVNFILEKLDEQKNISIWGAWEELWWAYAVIYKKDKIWDDAVKKGNVLDRMNISGLILEMKELLANRDMMGKYCFFYTDKFKRHIQRVQNKLNSTIEDLSSVENKTNNSHNDKLIIIYNPKDCLLTIGDKSLNIKYGSKQSELCKIIFANRQNMLKKWDREEILEIWHEKNTDNLYLENCRLNPKFRRQIYNACDKIKIKIALITGINDLLIYDTQSVSLNSKYVS